MERQNPEQRKLGVIQKLFAKLRQLDFKRRPGCKRSQLEQKKG